MLSKGPAKKVTIYVNEDTQHHLGPLYEAILTFLLHTGVSGATATKAHAGFGAHHKLHTPNIVVLAEHLPMRVEFVESAEKVDELLPTLYDMVADGLIEVQDTVVIRAAQKATKPAPATPHEEKRQPAKLMRVFMGEADRWHGEPLHDAMIKRLRMMDIAGATVYRGIAGYGAKGHEHKQGRFRLSHDLPVMISVIDSDEKIAAAVSVVEEMLEEGLIALSDVDMIRLVRSRPPVEKANGKS